CDQLRRVEHDGVEMPAIGDHLAQVNERVGMHVLDADLVEIRVFLRQRERVLIEVDTCYVARLANALGPQTEPPRVATNVEDAGTGAQVGDRTAVVALIAEEPSLVPAVDIDAETDSPLLHDHARPGIRYNLGGSHTFELARAIVSADHRFPLHGSAEHFG